MPLYAYRCTDCADFESRHAMGQAPDRLPCPECGRPAARVLTAPHLSRRSSSEYQLIERTQRSASEPDVVASTGNGQRAPRGTTASNPLHRGLPRPD